MTKNSLNLRLNNFLREGYCVVKIFKKIDLDNFKKKILKKISKNLKKNNIKIKELKNYHKIINDELHSEIIDSSKRYIDLNRILQKKILSNKFIHHICKSYWGHSKRELNWVASLKKNQIRKNATAFRLARPKNLVKKNRFKDVGGVHFDLFYGSSENYNYKALITVWCPIIGFSKLYTLRFAPKSHLKVHKKSNLENQKKYLSPVFKKKYVKNFNYIRPNLRIGEAIIFHPNLLHGGSKNLGSITRCSLDFRITNPKILKLNRKK